MLYWMEGSRLPTAPGSNRRRVITEWEPQSPDPATNLGGIIMQTIFSEGYVYTRYEPSGIYEGIDVGELYDMGADWLQQQNLWSDPGYRSLRDNLPAELLDSLTPHRSRWPSREARF